jgi:hypothetical protein
MDKKVQIGGYATIIGSKNYPEGDAEKLLEAPEGYHAELKVNVPASIQGKLKKNAKTGSLACYFAIKSSDCEIVIVPDKEKSPNVDKTKLAASLM